MNYSRYPMESARNETRPGAVPWGPSGGGSHWVLSAVLTVMLALVVFSMGCTVKVEKVWFHLRHPWGILVGILCQFGLMPLIAYLLSLAFSVKPVQALAILIMGCCPGGAISNIVTYWVDGDIDLSITMTSFSTVLGMGMMPLCLYVYSRSWVLKSNVKIPYSNIGITLLTLVVPVAGGAYVNFKWPKAARIILKVGSVAGGFLVLVIGIASAVLYKGSWNTDTSVLIIGITYPMIGYSAGFLVAVVIRQPWKNCRTIAMETGAQNVQICSTLLQLSFPPEQLQRMITFPLIYGSFQLINSLLLVTVYQMYKKIVLRKSQNLTVTSQDLRYCPREENGQGQINTAFENDQPFYRNKTGVNLN